MKAFKLLGIRIIIGVKSERSYHVSQQKEWLRDQALENLTRAGNHFFGVIGPKGVCDCAGIQGQNPCYFTPLTNALDLATKYDFVS